jgi:alpha-methylacyl-CoA racemase
MAGPLAGVRVVELAGIGPVPYACLLLAELGADVVRVDRPGGAGLDAAPTPTLNRSRPTIHADLKDPAGVRTVLRLAAAADVLVEGMRPGVAERLGVGPEPCHARNPALVYARMTGWGQDGPLAQAPGHDINYAGLVGAVHATGSEDKPRQALNLVADFGGGSLFLLVGILAALLERQRSGLGQVIDAAMVDGAASLLTMVYGLHADGQWSDQREDNLLDGGAPFYDTYRCADGKHVAVGALEPQFYAALLDGLELSLDTHQLDRTGWPAQRHALTRAFATRTRDQWCDHFTGTNACVTPVLGLHEAPHHPHLQARATFTPQSDGYQPAAAPRFSRTPGHTPAEVAASAGTAAFLNAAGFTNDQAASLLSKHP